MADSPLLHSAHSTRDALASADEVIGRVRAASGEPAPDAENLTAIAYLIADEWERHVERLANEARLSDAARGFRQRWPALVRWRERVLANRRRAKPAVVAAAFESLALECLLAGEMDLSARAQQAAIDMMQRVARQAIRLQRSNEAKSA